MFQLSGFELEAPVFGRQFPFSHFEMILAQMSDIYEFLKSIALFADLMRKSLLLLKKLGARIAHDHHFMMSSIDMSTKALIFLAQAK